MQIWEGMDGRWWWGGSKCLCQTRKKWKLFRIRRINTAAVARQALARAQGSSGILRLQ